MKLDFQEVEPLELFSEIAKTLPLEKISEALGLHTNTVGRWRETQKVPRHYIADFLRLLGKPHPVTNVKDGDQYYTKPKIAEHCYQSFCNVAKEIGVDLSDYTFIEPSAGCGCFYQQLPDDRKIGIDIAPGIEEIVESDFLRWSPDHKGNYVVIGNPPFGLRGHLALQFINHAANFADMVGFILPQLFESDGKGVPGKRVKGYELAHSEKLPPNSFSYPNGNAINIFTVFQVWTRVNADRITLEKPATCKSYIKIYSLSDGGTPSSTRNKKMIDKCDVYLPSTCYSSMGACNNFEWLPHRRGYGVVILRDKAVVKKMLMEHNWEKTAFYSTNSAMNLRSSLIESVLTDAGFMDNE